MKVILWWMPGDFAIQSQVAVNNPDWYAKNKDGSYQKFIGPWGEESTDVLLCPSLPEVQEWHKNFTAKAINTWGFDGFKLDSQYTVRECYNPSHNHTEPGDSVADYPLIYKAIYDEAVRLNPDFTINICNCGVNQSFYLYPYQNRVVTSDPWSGASHQLRQRTKVLKALFGAQMPVLADHVERRSLEIQEMLGLESVNNVDIKYLRDTAASSIGTGSVLETVYTDISGARLAEYQKWFGLGSELELTSGEFLGNLYTYGFDFPEAYAVKKNNTMYYGFYSDGSYSASIELRGLESGKQYTITDYVTGRSYGTVMAENTKITLSVEFEDYLLLKAVPAAN